MSYHFSSFLILHVVSLGFLILDHEDCDEQASNEHESRHAIEDVLLILFVLVDSLVDKDEGDDFSDLFAQGLHAVGPSAVVLLDIVIQEWVLHDSLCQDACCNATDPIETICFFDELGLWQHHTNCEKEEANKEDFLT